eukprot:1361571-Amorphochlora_amoeboformis.AAC.2
MSGRVFFVLSSLNTQGYRRRPLDFHMLILHYNIDSDMVAFNMSSMMASVMNLMLISQERADETGAYCLDGSRPGAYIPLLLLSNNLERFFREDGESGKGESWGWNMSGLELPFVRGRRVSR